MNEFSRTHSGFCFLIREQRVICYPAEKTSVSLLHLVFQKKGVFQHITVLHPFFFSHMQILSFFGLFYCIAVEFVNDNTTILTVLTVRYGTVRHTAQYTVKEKLIKPRIVRKLPVEALEEKKETTYKIHDVFLSRQACCFACTLLILCAMTFFSKQLIWSPKQTLNNGLLVLSPS